MVSVVRLAPPTKLTCGGHDLDAFVVELADGTLDFRLELGLGLGIYWALPAAPGDRLRRFHVDGAAYTVDEPTLEADPFVFDLAWLAWRGELGVLGDGRTVTAVTVTASAGAGYLDAASYRVEITLRATTRTSETRTFAWRQR